MQRLRDRKRRMDRWILAALVVALTGGALAAPSLPVIPGGSDGEEGGSNGNSSSSSSAEEGGTVPSLPVEWQAMSCELHFSGISFGGLREACSTKTHHHHHQRNLHSRCCPVLASWLYAAQAETTMDALSSSSASSSSSSSSLPSPQQVEMPVPPDDSAVCAAALQQGLHSHGIDLPPLNASCDMSLCYCGIKLRQMVSLSCPLGYFHRNRSAVLPSQAPFLREVEANCSDSSYSGCGSCISALDNSMVWIEEKTVVGKKSKAAATLDCRLMGLMWLLSSNRTRFIPTVSAVLRAIVYNHESPHQDHSMATSSHGSSSAADQCSRDDADLPLAIDRLGDDDKSSASSIAANFGQCSKLMRRIAVTCLVILSQLWWVRL